ncbi:MOSC domain-containing protein [Actinomadura fibrosa]|uniref:MOSC domain-containing protein n=1 Tax=Actinomadura fibrosa TaxID=111802 RepID=A0ABW2XU89_9ACTN|nr:MOSC domain-containing protein [Actinomadura fibrosa]
MVDTLAVRGVYVGTPQVAGNDVREVWSAIRKAPVTEPEIALGETGLAGDRQADPVAHGGPDKAVYVYPSANYAFWRAVGSDLEPARVGENLAVAGPDEREVRIGDVWSWGEALVQVSQPRTPCYKLAAHTGRTDVAAHMIGSGRCGWYLRVLRAGRVPTGGELRRVETDPAAPTVHALFTGSYAPRDRVDPAGLRRMIGTPALGEQWRQGVLARLARIEAP